MLVKWQDVEKFNGYQLYCKTPQKTISLKIYIKLQFGGLQLVKFLATDYTGLFQQHSVHWNPSYLVQRLQVFERCSTQLSFFLTSCSNRTWRNKHTHPDASKQVLTLTSELELPNTHFLDDSLNSSSSLPLWCFSSSWKQDLWVKLLSTESIYIGLMRF